jgi:hypothetical protein
VEGLFLERVARRQVMPMLAAAKLGKQELPVGEGVTS